ncbi:MAG TPA: nitrogenase iron-molybdenum cofactor biosynthesis protein NifN [Kineosporiaceae bacterium]
MATVTLSGRRGATDPLKLSRPLGAALAFLGLERCMPLLHGPQGCAAFAKALLTKHFREPVPLQTTAVTELTAVLGAAGHLVTALDTIRSASAPDVIGVITTGVSETSGEDVEATVREYRLGRASGPQDPLVVLVRAPDFIGGLSDGWSAALASIVAAGLEAPPEEQPVRSGPLAFPLLAGVSLAAGDLDELEAMIAGFGVTPVLVPDLSRSLDGHLAPAWSPLTTGGTGRAALAALAAAPAAASAGASAAAAAETLARGGVPVARFDHLAGLEAVDAFVDRLRTTTSEPVPDRVRRDRARLADGLLDTHFVLGGARVAVAAEPELLTGVTHLLASAGARVVAAVSPTDEPVLTTAACEEVVVGDLSDLRARAAEGGAEVVIGSSHTVATARAVGAGHLPLGLPVDHRFGAALNGVAGYRGGLAFVFRAADVLLARQDDAHPAPAAPSGPVPVPAHVTDTLRSPQC